LDGTPERYKRRHVYESMDAFVAKLLTRRRSGFEKDAEPLLGV
jgi:hypothetical protein